MVARRGGTRGACADGRREILPGFCRDRKIGRFPECFPRFQNPGSGPVETGRFRGRVPKKVAHECAGTGETGNAGKPRMRTETSEPLVRGHPCPHWRSCGVRRSPSTEPNGLEHVNDDSSGSGSAEVTPVMRAGMPADHVDLCTGELSVSAKVGQMNRTDWNTPITARHFREVLP